jgi:hypothetical protein
MSLDAEGSTLESSGERLGDLSGARALMDVTDGRSRV